jgi:hypothetical protein
VVVIEFGTGEVSKFGDNVGARSEERVVSEEEEAEEDNDDEEEEDEEEEEEKDADATDEGKAFIGEGASKEANE